METLPAELEDAIVADPHDREAYAVAGDWLTDRGDPQGELVALSLAASSPQTEDRILELQTRLAPVDTGRESSTRLEWRWGFIHGASYSGTDPAELRRLLTAPSARFLHKLVFVIATPQTIEQLAVIRRTEPRALRCLRTLVLGHGLGSSHEIDLGNLALPSLHRLGLRFVAARGRLDLPLLRELMIAEVPDPDRVIADSDLPALERLHVAPRRELLPLGGWLVPDYLPALRRFTVLANRTLATETPPIFDQLALFDQFVAQTGRPMTRVLTIDRTVQSSDAALLVMIGRGGRTPGTLIRVRPGFSIGRDPANDLVLADPDVRVRHAAIHDHQRWRIHTLEDQGLTYVESHPIPDSPLRDGDELTIGRHTFRFLEGDIVSNAAQVCRQFGLAR